MFNYKILLWLSIIFIFLSGCNPVGDEKIEVRELGTGSARIVEQKIRINNCGSRAEAKHVETHGVAVDFEGEVGVGYQLLEAGLRARYTRGAIVSKELTAPPNSNMEWVIAWTENTVTGTVKSSFLSDEVGYRVFIPLSGEQVSAQELICPGTQSVIPVEPIERLATETTAVITNTLPVSSPEVLGACDSNALTSEFDVSVPLNPETWYVIQEYDNVAKVYKFMAQEGSGSIIASIDRGQRAWRCPNQISAQSEAARGAREYKAANPNSRVYGPDGSEIIQ